MSSIKGVFSTVAADFLAMRNTFPKFGFVFNPFTGLIIPKQGSILTKWGLISRRWSNFPKRGSIIPKRDLILRKRGLLYALECSVVIKSVYIQLLAPTDATLEGIFLKPFYSARLTRTLKTVAHLKKVILEKIHHIKVKKSKCSVTKSSS